MCAGLGKLIDFFFCSACALRLTLCAQYVCMCSYMLNNFISQWAFFRVSLLLLLLLVLFGCHRKRQHSSASKAHSAPWIWRAITINIMSANSSLSLFLSLSLSRPRMTDCELVVRWKYLKQYTPHETRSYFFCFSPVELLLDMCVCGEKSLKWSTNVSIKSILRQFQRTRALCRHENKNKMNNSDDNGTQCYNAFLCPFTRI